MTRPIGAARSADPDRSDCGMARAFRTESRDAGPMEPTEPGAPTPKELALASDYWVRSCRLLQSAPIDHRGG